jgi:hypothetical protein
MTDSDAEGEPTRWMGSWGWRSGLIILPAPKETARSYSQAGSSYFIDPLKTLYDFGGARDVLI